MRRNLRPWKWFTKEEKASWPIGHKKCRVCGEVKPFEQFHSHKNARIYGNVMNDCKACRLPVSKQLWQKRKSNPTTRLWSAANSRASAKGWEFSIAKTDIVIPELCPVFGVPFEKSGPYSMSLDRIDSSKGYIPGNIQVISTRANMLKNNGTLEEFRALVKFLEL